MPGVECEWATRTTRPERLAQKAFDPVSIGERVGYRLGVRSSSATNVIVPAPPTSGRASAVPHPSAGIFGELSTPELAEPPGRISTRMRAVARDRKSVV